MDDILTVPGSVSAYPLKFGRTFNSHCSFGALNRGGRWLFSYISYEYRRYSTEHFAAFPDGRVINFNANGGQGPYGITERIESDYPYSVATVRLADGGAVVFEKDPEDSNPGIDDYKLKKIVDPYGMETTVTKLANGKTQITDASGRYLLVTPGGGGVARVDAFDGQSSTPTQWVTYSWSGNKLTQVNYSDGTSANYTYTNQRYRGAVYCTYPFSHQDLFAWVLETADDSHFGAGGAMRRIGYVYQDSGPNRTRIKSENYLNPNGSIGEVVASVTGDNGRGDAVETRGDGFSRHFIYDEACRPPDCPRPDTEPCPQPDPTAGKLIRYTDFYSGAGPGNTTIIGYETDENAASAGHITSVTDANQHTTTYTRSPVSWAITRITHPDQTHINQTYFNEAKPYFLKTRTDERGNTVEFERNDPNNPNAITKKIYPPDRSGQRAFEQFWYNSFRQVTKHRLTTGAYQHFGYDARGLLIDKSNPTFEADTNTAFNGPKTHFDYYPANHAWADRVSRETDPNGKVVEYDYDYALTNSEIKYSASGTKVGGRGFVTRIRFVSDTHGGQYSGGTEKKFCYNAYGDKMWEENELGKRITYIYDDYGRIKEVWNPLDEKVLTTYAPSGVSPYRHTSNSPDTVTSVTGTVTKTVYDPNWRKTSVTAGFGTAQAATTWFHYDPEGNLDYVTDPRGSVSGDATYTTRTTYDLRDRKLQVTDPQGHATTFHYDETSNVTAIDQPNGMTQTKKYDALGRVYEQTDPKDGPAVSPTEVVVTKFEFYPGNHATNAGLLWQVKDGKDQTTTFEYDAAGLKTKMIYPATATGTSDPSKYRQWTYDNSKNVTARRTVGGVTQNFVYDARNRKTSMSWSNAGSNPAVAAENATFVYDAAGRLTSAQNGNSTVTRTYDDAGRLLKDSQNLTGLGAKDVEYQHLPGQRKERMYVTSANYDYTFTTDNQDRIEKIYPTGAPSTIFQYGYDAASNETQRTNPTGVAQNYGRDNLNRMTRRELVRGNTRLSVETYGYDALRPGLLTSVDREDTSRDSFSYDLWGELITADYAVPQSTPAPSPSATPVLSPTPSISPPPLLSPTPSVPPGPTIPPGITPTPSPGSTPTPTPPLPTPTPKCERVNLSIVSGGWPNEMYIGMSSNTNEDKIFYTQKANSPPGAPTHNGSTQTGNTATYGSPIKVNAGSRIFFKAIAYKQGWLDSDVEEYEADNTNPNNGPEPGGDPALPTAPSATGPRRVSYVFDKAGNRNSVVDGDGVNTVTKAYTPNHLNQYDVAENTAALNGPEHGISSFEGVSYTYINDERLSSLTGSGGNYQLAYDALGRCVKRTLNAVTTYYIYDGEKPILEYSATGTLTAKNLCGKGIDEILLRIDPSYGTLYYQQDHEGSVTHITNDGGEVIESYRYDAFGAPRMFNQSNVEIPDSALGNRFLFTGREYAKEFAIYEYRARAYHPKLGRFTSEDPKLFDAGDYNLFRYCHNDPVNFTDPMGLAGQDSWDKNLEKANDFKDQADLMKAKSWNWKQANGKTIWGNSSRLQGLQERFSMAQQAAARVNQSNSKDMPTSMRILYGQTRDHSHYKYFEYQAFVGDKPSYTSGYEVKEVMKQIYVKGVPFDDGGAKFRALNHGKWADRVGFGALPKNDAVAFVDQRFMVRKIGDKGPGTLMPTHFQHFSNYEKGRVTNLVWDMSY